MSEALSYLYSIYSKFLTFVFDDMEMFEGVYFGWVIFAIIVFSILVRNLLVIPMRSRIFLHRSDVEDRIMDHKMSREVRNG